MPSQWSAEDNSVPGIGIRGGAHGLTVEYRELEAVAGSLEGAVTRLTSLRSETIEAYLLLSGTSAVYTHASHAAGAAELVIQGLDRNMAELQEAAEDLRRAAHSYMDTEGRLESVFAWMVRAPAGLDRWHKAGGKFPDRAASDLVVPPFDGFVIEKLMKRLADGRFGELRPVSVERLGGREEEIPLSGSARDLLGGSKRLLDGPDRGVVEILTVNGGKRPVRIVTLPGNQESGNAFVGPNPFDNYGNAEGRAEDSRYIAGAVAESLRLAGASADDAVILVGYSQGGIHAVNVGSRLQESGEFSVEMIVTAGSPAGDRNTPEGVKVLNLEHYQDWVPGLDGTLNPDTPDRITVTGWTPVPGEGSPGGLGPAHALDQYLLLAGEADASRDPSLQESLGYLAEIIPPASIATRGLFKFARKSPAKPSAPAPAPDPAPTPSPSPQAPPALPARPGQ